MIFYYISMPDISETIFWKVKKGKKNYCKNLKPEWHVLLKCQTKQTENKTV